MTRYRFYFRENKQGAAEHVDAFVDDEVEDDGIIDRLLERFVYLAGPKTDIFVDLDDIKCVTRHPDEDFETAVSQPAQTPIGEEDE